MLKISKWIQITLLVSLAMNCQTYACTGIQLKASDGSFVNGRTVEFGIPLNISGLLIPRGTQLKGTLPDGSDGLHYQSKFAALGGNMFQEPAIADGINEKGLSVGAFYFPGYAKYAAITPANKSHALSPTQFANWLLTQFESVEEIKNGLNSIVIAPTTPPGWPTLPPLHYIVYDRVGNSIVIEPLNGKLVVYNNPLGVMTNSPTFDWHITNLSNYINLSPLDVPPLKLNGLKVTAISQGSGMRGLPGDFSSPSRFIRATAFSQSAIPSQDATQAVLQAFHLLNQFDIPVGVVRDVNNKVVRPEYTLVTTVKDTKNNRYYFKTYHNQTIKVINMSELPLTANKMMTIQMDSPQSMQDVTSTAQ